MVMGFFETKDNLKFANYIGDKYSTNHRYSIACLLNFLFGRNEPQIRFPVILAVVSTLQQPTDSFKLTPNNWAQSSFQLTKKPHQSNYKYKG